VLEDLEVVARQIGDRRAVARRIRVDAHIVGFGAECRLLRRLRADRGQGAKDADDGKDASGQQSSLGQGLARTVYTGPRASSASIRRRVAAMSASRPDRSMPAVSIGSPMRMLSVAGRTNIVPFCIAASPPWTATGTIGACALMAMMKPPFLNGSS